MPTPTIKVDAISKSFGAFKVLDGLSMQRRRRQTDLLRERQLGDAPVALDGVENPEVDRVKFRYRHAGFRLSFAPP